VGRSRAEWGDNKVNLLSNGIRMGQGESCVPGIMGYRSSKDVRGSCQRMWERQCENKIMNYVEL
jgi:hypothetical protein